jgi:hypothetical protein
LRETEQVTPPNTREAVGFYWAKVHYHYDPEPLIRWEVLHWEDGAWWATALRGPVVEGDVLEFRERLVEPDEG